MAQDEIKKFDAEDAMKKIKDRIKSAFVDMIPDEQWEEMVKTEVDGYFKVEDRSSYTHHVRFSTFQTDVHRELEFLVKEKIKEHLTTHFAPKWDKNGTVVANEHVETFIKNNIGALMTGMIGTVIQNSLINAGHNMG